MTEKECLVESWEDLSETLDQLVINLPSSSQNNTPHTSEVGVGDSTDQEGDWEEELEYQHTIKKQLHSDHIVEIYALRPGVSENGLKILIQNQLECDVDIIKVSEWERLLIFPQKKFAAQFLQQNHARWKSRGWEEASDLSKKWPLDELQPRKIRPKRSMVVLQQHVQRHLGVKNLVDQNALRELQSLRKQKQKDKERAKLMKNQTWDG